MATKVLDSWALIAFFEDEPAAEAVEKLLQQAADEKHKLLMSVVNWGEVYYNTMREVSQQAAEQKAQEIAALPIDIQRGAPAGQAGRLDLHLWCHCRVQPAGEQIARSLQLQPLRPPVAHALARTGGAEAALPVDSGRQTQGHGIRHPRVPRPTDQRRARRRQKRPNHQVPVAVLTDRSRGVTKLIMRFPQPNPLKKLSSVYSARRRVFSISRKSQARANTQSRSAALSHVAHVRRPGA